MSVSKIVIHTYDLINHNDMPCLAFARMDSEEVGVFLDEQENYVLIEASELSGETVETYRDTFSSGVRALAAFARAVSDRQA
jgi:hypothetical protein